MGTALYLFYSKHKGFTLSFWLIFQVFGTMVSNDKLDESSNFTIIDITFVVTRSPYPSMDYTTLLPKVWGALGLWLGLGVIQLFSSAVNLFSVCTYFIFECLKRQ